MSYQDRSELVGRIQDTARQAIARPGPSGATFRATLTHRGAPTIRQNRATRPETALHATIGSLPMFGYFPPFKRALGHSSGLPAHVRRWR